MTDGLERNEARWWYDRGYALGVAETERDAVFPLLVGAWTLLGMTLWEPAIAATFLAMYTLFATAEWRDRRDEAADKRERYDPGSAYEWTGDEQ
jgi:hypothetical protein